MSDDNGWFSSEDSSNDADAGRRLEAVPPPSEPVAEEWFDAEPSAPAAPARPSAPAGKSGNRKAKLIFAGSVVVVLGVLVAGSWMVAGALSGPTESEAVPLAVPAAESSAASDASPSDCVEQSDGEAVTSSGEGDTASPAGVVLAFQYAYYVDRDADKVKPLLAKESEIRDLDALQKGIDSVAKGTTHCVQVDAPTDGRVSVEVTEISPDETQTIYRQTVTTTRESGEVRIVSITESKEDQ